ncbi:SDR family NAD(P)-dependent oxidoreductase [Pseudomonas sp. GV085]|uniref:SDR family NAD(P)-dependent oxidoreductase n=1 Tax=Pseudomonas sp. GV085 TaxID=2135756 RepID=UPI000D3FF2E5|nr:SDR family NAD(P)-dependent oxidoreductase [Pseudomonas sp. GV085]PTR21299.1 short subunit dehydrogenase [Pseudomonas sp. GV085]
MCQVIETFGDLNVVVNNAGICRDRMFASPSEADWDVVVAVHLKGHFCISSHAVKYWRGQVEGGKLSIADGWRRGPQLDRQGRWAVGEMGDAVAQLMTQAVPAAKVYGS